MKHLFYIHSNITYLVSKAVIKYHQMDVQDVIMLFARNTTPFAKDKDIYTTCLFTEIPDFNNNRNIFKTRAKLNRFLKRIDNITGGSPYFAYVPQTKERKMQILIHNKLCEGFSIIEEGTDNYLSKQELANLHPPHKIKLYQKMNYRNLVKSNAFFEDDYKHVYGISDQSFPGYDRKIVLKDALNSNLKRQLKLKGEYLLIFDAVSIYNEISLQTHCCSIKKLLDYFVKIGIDQVLYKYHPAQLDTKEVEVFENLLKNYEPHITFNRLGNDVIIESLIMQGEQLKFFVNISSLGMYASLHGHEVYTFARYIIEEEQRFERLFNLYSKLYPADTKVLASENPPANGF